jgi:argininosuccinate lyase
MSKKKGIDKPWGGRFSEKTAVSTEAFTASVHFDVRLASYDIRGSKAHARMLARQGLLSEEEGESIVAGLEQIETEIKAGQFTFQPELEDVHMNIEKALIEKIGAAGEKLHTARSRNDQVALDMRLYLRDVSRHFVELLIGVQKGLVRFARQNLDCIMPGYTHLQRAQPVLAAHHLLAYYEMFGRDIARLGDGLQRINVMPLGSAALAGTGLPIDRQSVARDLDFPAISANSMDAVGDRDFVVEFLATAALIQIHLSRLAEELVLWTSQEFSFIEIADRFCTGSSIMPQKKNPDIPELIRGKSGRVTGNLMAMLMVLKGLPLTYNRDLQEDKEAVFDSVDTVGRCLEITAEMLAGLRFKRENLAAASRTGFLTATDLADYLVRKNMPFRQAHAVVGRIVAHCLDNGQELTELSLDELQDFAPMIEADVLEVLSVAGSVASRQSFGGTGLQQVEAALARAEEVLGI